MPRTNEDEVGGIIEVDTAIDLTPFITLANELVTEHCTNSGYTTSRLLLIETWLAAHFYAIRDPRSLREEVTVIRNVYLVSNGLGLDQTTQGQQVKIIDSAGNLAALDNRLKETKGIKRKILWLGK